MSDELMTAATAAVQALREEAYRAGYLAGFWDARNHMMRQLRDIKVPDAPVNIPPVIDRSVNPLTIELDEKTGLELKLWKMLRRAGITTVGDLVQRCEDDLLDIRDLGSKRLREVNLFLEKFGLKLKEGDNYPHEPFEG